MGASVKILDDSPVDKDAFEGAHEKIAEAILRLILTNKGGKAIALMGAWGSGKSTIIEMLKKKANNNVAVFVFDAWEHQDDPLRRVFIEELINFLIQKKWLENKNKWEEEKGKISRKLRIRWHFPKLTKAGKIIVLFSFLVLFLSVISIPQKGIVKYIVPKNIALITVLIGLLSLIPPLKRWFLGNDVPYKQVVPWYSFLIAWSKIDGSLTYETPEPTSVEFQESFSKILKESLNKRNRKLVIVMDNLDRISKKEAISLWGTMKIFFNFNRKNEKWLDKFWLIVPFDPKAPSRLWTDDFDSHSHNAGEDNEENSIEKGEKGNNSHHENPGENRGYDTKREKQESTSETTADAFVNKTFQIKFFVPPVFPSDLVKFFNEQFKKAFMDPHAKEKVYDILYIFDEKRRNKNYSPTPREVKLFINDLVGYYIMWKGEIPLTTQAVYAISTREEIRKKGAKDVLLNNWENYKKSLEKIWEVINDGDIQRNLAALYFNVAPDKALGFLVENDVLNYLKDGKCKAIKELKSKLDNEEHLWQIINNVIRVNISLWQTSNPSAIAKSAYVINKLGNPKDKDLKIWQKLLLSIPKVKSPWRNLNDDKVCSGLLALMDRVDIIQEKKKRKEIYKTILSKLDTPTVLPGEKNAYKKWLTCLCKMFQRVFEKFSETDEVMVNFRVPGDENFYIEIVKSLGGSKRSHEICECEILIKNCNEINEDRKVFKYLRPAVEIEKVIKKITEIYELKLQDIGGTHG